MANIDTDKLKQLLMAMIETIEDSESNNQEEAPAKKKNTKPKQTKTSSTTRNKNGRKPYTSSENLFDSMPEMHMHKNDTAIDKMLSSSSERTPRNRPSSMVNARCRVCGKEETVSKRLVTDSNNRYKCNNCSRGSG